MGARASRAPVFGVPPNTSQNISGGNDPLLHFNVRHALKMGHVERVNALHAAFDCRRQEQRVIYFAALNAAGGCILKCF